MDRFTKEYGPGMTDDQGDEVDSLPSNLKSSKPSDFHTLFDENNNDHFMIGIKFTR